MLKKNVCLSVFSSWLFCSSSMCFSLPTDPHIIAGSAEIHHVDAHTMEIRPSDQAILNYKDFHIGSHEKLRFIQDSSRSCVLNRVSGGNPSQILGSLESNGKVFLVNPHGIYFGPNSQVNVGSLIASTLDIANEDFAQEKYRFSLAKGQNASIVNEGILQSAEGSIVLLAPHIKNMGYIQAKAGTVVLASGEHVTLDFTGDGLIQFSVEGSVKDCLIEHLGNIQASVVSMKLPVAKKAITEIVNVEGMEEADVFIEENGVIKFASASQVKSQKVHVEGSQVSIQGTIDAANKENRGGEVHFFGKNIFLEGAKIDASGLLGGGEVLVGGEFQGKGTTPYASQVTLDASSEIYANASEEGNGGLVVLWSQDQTQFDGKIFAQGGRIHGDGGLVETSSKNALGVSSGYVSTYAPQGSYGKWLLDPTVVSIVESGSNTCSPTYGNCSSGTNCTIAVSTINTANSNVFIQAGTTIAIQTDISMQNPGIGIEFHTCYTGTNITVSGNVYTSGGSIVFDAPEVDLLISPITIDSTMNNTFPDGNTVTFVKLNSTSSVDSYVYGGTTGVVTVGSMNGQSSVHYIGSMTVVSAASMTSGGFQTSEGNISFPSNAPLYFTQGSSGLSSLHGNVSVGSLSSDTGGTTLTMQAGSGTLQINGPITSMNNLTLTNAASVVITDNITASGTIFITPDVIFTGNSTIEGSSISFRGSVDGPGSLALQGGDISFEGLVGNSSALTELSVQTGSVTAWPRSITTTGALTFTPAVTIASGEIPVMAGGAITFGNSLDGPGGLVLQGGNIAFMGLVGSSSSLSELSVQTGFVTTWPSSIYATVIAFTPALSLSTALDLTGTTIGFSNALSGTGSLNVNGGTSSFTDTVSLSSFTLATGSIDTWPSSITTTGALTFTPHVVIPSGVIPTLTGSPITFENSVEGPGGLILDGGNITFLGLVGNTHHLSSLSIDTGTLVGWPLSISAGRLIFTSPVVINSGVVSSLTGTGSIEFSDTVNGPGGLVLHGDIILDADVGGATILSEFTLASGTVSQWPSSIQANIMSFTPDMDLSSSVVTLTSTTSTTFSGRIDGPGDLALNGGEIIFANAVGANTSLSSFSLETGSITTWPSSITAATLNFTPNVSVSSGSSILTGSTSITFGGTIDGPGGLDLYGGTLRFGGILGSSSSLSRFSFHTGSIATWPSSIDAAEIGFTPAILIPGTLTLTSSTSTTFASTVDGAGNLMIDGGPGSVIFEGAVGENTPLMSLQVSSASFVNFADNVSADTISITPPTNFTGVSDFTGSSITFANSMNGPGSLTLTGGTISLSGAVGSSSALASFSLLSGNMTVCPTLIQTVGLLHLTPTVTLNASTTLSSSSGPITVNAIQGSLAGTQSLLIQAGTGSFSVGEIGTSTPLGPVQMVAATLSDMQSIITQSGSVSISAPVLLTANTTIDSTHGGNFAGAAITLESIEAYSTGTSAESLTINATSTGGESGLITLNGALGSSSHPLGAVTILGSASSSQVVIASSIWTNSIAGGAGGQIIIDPPIYLTGSSTISSVASDSSGANISLSNVVPSDVQTLDLLAGIGSIEVGSVGSSEHPIGSMIITGDAVTLLGSIYARGADGSLTITNAGTLTIQSGDIDLTGSFSQKGSGSVLLGNNITASEGSLFFQSPITLSESIRLTSYADLTLSSEVIGTSPVALALDSIHQAIYVEQLGTDSNPLGTVTFTANGLSSLAGIVTENGDIDIRPPILLTSLLTVLDTSAGTSSGFIRFQNTVNAKEEGSQAQALLVSAGDFDVTFLGEVGGSFPLGGLQVQTTAEVTLSGNIFTTSLSSSSLGGSIQVEGSVFLSKDSQIDSKRGGGANISFTGPVDGDQHLIVRAGIGSIALSADIGSNTALRSFVIESANNVEVQSVTTIDAITILPHISISQTPSTAFSSLNNGDIYLGPMDGSTSLIVSTENGKITLGEIGQSIALEKVLVTTGSQASIHSILTSDVITIPIPIVLLESTLLSTTARSPTGSTITLGLINASTTGEQTLTVDAGSSQVVLLGDVGVGESPGNFQMTGGLLSLENASLFTAGTQQYKGPVAISQNIVFRSQGDISFQGMIDPVSGSPSLSVFVGGGTLTFTEAVGDAPFGDVIIHNANSFIAQEILASSLTVSGGLPNIYLQGDVVLSGDAGVMLDGGPIFLGGTIEAPFYFFRSHGNISNIASPCALTSTGRSQFDFNYLNAIGGTVGSQVSPIDMNTEQLLIVGASPRADFIGNPMHDSVRLARGNAPCIVTFNGIEIVNCHQTSFSARQLFNSLPKDLFYVPGIYSSWDNLSNWEYFEQEPADLGANWRDLKMFYFIGPADKKALIKQVFSGFARLRQVEAELRNIELQLQPVSWEFFVELSEDPPLLDLLPVAVEGESNF